LPRNERRRFPEALPIPVSVSPQHFGDFKMNKFARFSLGASLASLGTAAMAAVDTAGVETAITAAQTSAEGVGGAVIAAVAALVVIGLIIGIVRKL
jgi:hypothetical protein